MSEQTQDTAVGQQPHGVVVVGAGMAGVQTAVALRQRGFTGPVTLIGAEPHQPYDRPPLSKAVLRGEEPPETTRVHDDGFYAEHDIDLVTEAAADEGVKLLDLADRVTIGPDAVVEQVVG